MGTSEAAASEATTSYVIPVTDLPRRETLVRITGGGTAASEAVASDAISVTDLSGRETLVRITGGGPAASEAVASDTIPVTISLGEKHLSALLVENQQLLKHSLEGQHLK